MQNTQINNLVYYNVAFMQISFSVKFNYKSAYITQESFKELPKY